MAILENNLDNNGSKENQVQKNPFSRNQRRKFLSHFRVPKFKDRFEEKAKKNLKF